MKVLHAMNIIYPIKGIMKQVESEQEAARQSKIDWLSRSFGTFSGSDIYFKWEGGNPKNIFKFKKAYYRWIRDIVKNENVDVLLLRYQPYDIFQFLFVKSIKKEVKVYFVLHTFMVRELASSEGLRGKLKAFLEWLIGPLSISIVDGLVSVTREIGLRESKRSWSTKIEPIVYPNGILMEDIKPLPDHRSTNIPEFLFVASNFSPWHGLDLLVEEIKKSKLEFIVHLVGKVPSSDANYLEQDKRCVLHGTLTYEAIKKLMSKAWVGLSSFAHFRLGMKEASTLKVREYLLNGVPVYANYREHFPTTMIFYKEGKCNLEQMIHFAHEMRKYNREDVINASTPLIDKKNLLKNLYLSLKTNSTN